MLAVCAVLAAGCGNKNNGASTQNGSQSDASVEDSDEQSEVFEREYNEEGQVRSFLTGKWVDKEIGDMDTCVIGVFVGFTPFVYIVAMSAKQMINKCWL